MHAAIALRDAEIRRRVHWRSGQQHREIQMHAERYTCMTNDSELLTGGNRCLAGDEGWADGAEMTVDADESIMLHQHFESARAVVLDADQLAWCGGADRRAFRGRQIDAVVIGARLRAIRQDARTERR